MPAVGKLRTKTNPAPWVPEFQIPSAVQTSPTQLPEVVECGPACQVQRTESPAGMVIGDGLKAKLTIVTSCVVPLGVCVCVGVCVGVRVTVGVRVAVGAATVGVWVGVAVGPVLWVSASRTDPRASWCGSA